MSLNAALRDFGVPGVTPDEPTLERLDETLLWLCSIPSPIGEERALCDAVAGAARRAALAAAHPPLRRLDRRAR